MQADRVQQLMERLTHIAVIINDEYDWQILCDHNDAPQSEGKSNGSVVAAENAERAALNKLLFGDELSSRGAVIID
jgi:hypothetical protein